MRARVALLAVLAIAGCSDPESSRLEPGSKAVLTDKKLDQLVLTGEDGALITVPVGIAVRVGRDVDGTDRSREVTTTITEGPHSGQMAKVSRGHLKPIH